MSNNTISISKISEFLDFLSDAYEPDDYPRGTVVRPDLVMRGEPRKYSLPCSSLWYREIVNVCGKDDKTSNASYESYEDIIFDWWSKKECELLKKISRPHASDSEETADTWLRLARARHHGVPTRLVDFTDNPLVALWFACAKNWLEEEKNNTEDGYVYCALGKGITYALLKAKPIICSSENYKFGSKLHKKFGKDGEVKQFFLNPDGEHHSRITRQSGEFFVSSDVRKTIMDYDDIKVKIVCVPCTDKTSIIHELSRLGINRFSLGLITLDNAAEYTKKEAKRLIKHCYKTDSKTT